MLNIRDEQFAYTCTCHRFSLFSVMTFLCYIQLVSQCTICFPLSQQQAQFILQWAEITGREIFTFEILKNEARKITIYYSCYSTFSPLSRRFIFIIPRILSNTDVISKLNLNFVFTRRLRRVTPGAPYKSKVLRLLSLSRI